MATLILAMPGSGKTYAAKKGLISDVDYGYMRRSYGGMTDTGFIPELSANYLKMLYLLSQHGAVASNCPELLDEYILMGYKVTVVVPDNPVRRYEELRDRKEGVPTTKDKYMSWYQQWCELGARRDVSFLKGNVMEALTHARTDINGVSPLARFVDADMIKNRSVWSIERWGHYVNPDTGECRYVAELGDGLLVIKTLRDGVWTFKVWFNSNINSIESHWKTKKVGYVEELPVLS